MDPVTHLVLSENTLTVLTVVEWTVSVDMRVPYGRDTEHYISPRYTGIHGVSS